MQRDDIPQKTDRKLGEKSKFGNFLNPELVFPYGCLNAIALLLAYFEITDWFTAGFVGLWLCITWYLGVGVDAWKILSRLIKLPRWTSAQVRYSNKYKIPHKGRKW